MYQDLLSSWEAPESGEGTSIPPALVTTNNAPSGVGLRRVDASRLVYLQFADGPVTYADPSFRRALSNAIHWTSGHT